MFMHPEPQMYRARRVKRLVRAIPATAGVGVTIFRTIGTEALDHLDPFLGFDELLADSTAAIAGGFPEQAHRGFETITYMLEGRLNYHDNKGHSGVIGAGDVQWLTSGSGIVHSEMPEVVDGAVHGFQLWLNLPAAEKSQPAAYRDIQAVDVPAVIFSKAEVRVLAGKYHGLMGPLTPPTTQPFIVDVSLKAEGELTLPILEDHEGFIYVFDGGVAVEQSLINAGQAGILEHGNLLNLAAGQTGARLLIVTARPLNEPIVRHGPFVMNTQLEIKQAFTDYQNGLF